MFCVASSIPRDRANLQLNNRRLERKVKELVMQVDDEHLSLTDQKDQVRAPLPSLSHEILCPRPGHEGCVCRVHCSPHPIDVLTFPVRQGCPGSTGCPASPALASPAQLDAHAPSFLMQLSLRLKAMKRQVEEAEEEIDRLESSKKKLQRELEEQIGVNEQLQGQLHSMKKGFRWVEVATEARS